MRDLCLIFAMALGAIMLGVVLVGNGSGTLFGVSASQGGGAITIALVLALIGGMLWLATLSLGTAAVSALFWGVIGVALLVLVFFARDLGFFGIN